MLGTVINQFICIHKLFSCWMIDCLSRVNKSHGSAWFYRQHFHRKMCCVNAIKRNRLFYYIFSKFNKIKLSNKFEDKLPTLQENKLQCARFINWTGLKRNLLLLFPGKIVKIIFTRVVLTITRPVYLAIR